jgi:hypothetical protein
MTLELLPTKEPPTGTTQPEPPTPTPIAVAIPRPLTYVFELSRGGLYSGGGTIEAPSPTAAARTVEMTMAVGAKMRIIGYVPPRIPAQRAA